MSGRARESKRKATAVRDDERAEAVQAELETVKNRCKTLHALACEKAQEIIVLQSQKAALQKKVDDLQLELYKATNE
jgi:hypothetical protein